MAKQRHQDNQATSSKNTLIVMSIGALLVAGLVGWALTRTVEPTPGPTAASAAQFPTSTVATTPTDTPAVTTPTATDATATTGTLPPIASATAPMTMTSPAPSEHSQSPEKAAVARISAEDLRERVNNGTVTVIDVRDAASYAQGHIAGAMHVPFATVENQLASLPKGKDIVTYCT
jgi:hypothetical protein